MSPLKELVDTNKLSQADASEIQDIAKQNNWSDDTVKQFTHAAVEGLGIQNVETQNLASLLVAAKIKEAIYKQNAEQYKEEIAVNQKLLDQLYSRFKIQGGAPDKREDFFNMVNQRLAISSSMGVFSATVNL
ncbi:MAG: hypothetical protein DYG83_01690 [Candidatus Brocadia sp. AMX2]|uniref:Bifunctional protein n=1 Tax=Candidatus Brocadia sinica JPN1 TaxID=1197129 RepID=A0ABQ0JVE4_9BACT|nr:MULTISPECIES: hypothetical protein [Brocadia]KXK30065.1 MAG: hypothetical protein UZ01_01538 [Candidatus Brocadia sinica]MBC6930863.1 hypothetical protein [Candidatus Brocadia sp.]MBL1167832.1 hypothetical protein [Candidatus Brocadia sp. AMX1]NOG41446.1 hypothetical protein [Planctomycetota bacterium]KAA0245500.1 MAG: hypothetical protein EDM70_01045 [Candidatus Brocadia sp. AMX2]